MCNNCSKFNNDLIVEMEESEEPLKINYLGCTTTLVTGDVWTQVVVAAGQCIHNGQLVTWAARGDGSVGFDFAGLSEENLGEDITDEEAKQCVESELGTPGDWMLTGYTQLGTEIWTKLYPSGYIEMHLGEKPSGS